MKSQYIQLADDDNKALDWIRENLQVCGHNHMLSQKLLTRFLTASGPLIAIVPDWVDIDQLVDYRQGSVPPDYSPYPKGESPLDQLVVLVEDYLNTRNDTVVVCENSATARKTLEIWTWSRKPRASGYGENDLYYILQPSEADSEMIDAALSDSLGHFGIAVCSTSTQIPEGDMSDDSFLDEITMNAKHILMSAFDGDGYLIWSPIKRDK